MGYLLEYRGSRVTTGHTQVNDKGNETPMDNGLCDISNLQ